MNNQKLKLEVTNVFHRLGIAILITVAWVVGFEFLISLGGLVMNHNWSSFVVSLQGIPSTLALFINLVLLAYFIVTPYTDFKWSIQNGISRKTMWRGRLLALVLSTLVIFILDELLSLANEPIKSPRTLLINFLILLTGVVTCQAIGNGFGLLNRTGKWIVGIGIPVMLIIIMILLLRMLVAMGTSGLLLGYQHNHLVGTLFNNVATPYIVWLIYFVIVLFLTRLFNNHLQLRRD